MRRTTKITVETERLTIVRNSGTSLAWCTACGAEVEVITLADADATNPVQEWLNTGRLHAWQEPGGPTRICLRSLLLCLELDGISQTQIGKERS